jgi:hypothetical protein
MPGRSCWRCGGAGCGPRSPPSRPGSPAPGACRGPPGRRRPTWRSPGSCRPCALSGSARGGAARTSGAVSGVRRDGPCRRTSTVRRSPSVMRPLRPTPDVTMTSVSAPMRSGPVKGYKRFRPPVAVSVGHRRGQGGAPWWTNDLDAGEDRRRIGWREDPDDVAELAHTHPFGPPELGVRMTMASGPGCSVRSTAVLQAQAETRARPVWPSPVAAVAVAVWTSLRMWKLRASSRRAIATVAICLPRR